jgi:hypothetical protein
LPDLPKKETTGRETKMIVVYCHWDHPSVIKLYQALSEEVEGVFCRSFEELTDNPKFYLFSHGSLLPEYERILDVRKIPRNRGLRLPRATVLELANHNGIAVAEWIEFTGKDSLCFALQKWQRKEVIHKKSFTCKSAGVSVVGERECPVATAHDILMKPLQCRELYKIEFCHETNLVNWMCSSGNMPLRHWIHNSHPIEQRKLFQPDSDLLKKCAATSKSIWMQGGSHVSFDFVPDHGEFKLIEVNVCDVALHWTCYQDGFVDNYRTALRQGIPRAE